MHLHFRPLKDFCTNISTETLSLNVQLELVVPHSSTMRGCLLLLCLASLWGDSFSEECVRELQEDIDFPGSDVLQILSPDVHHCQIACTQHHSCLFFTFVRPDWTRDNRHFYCYLKHTSSGKPTKITSLQGVTSGYSLKPCKDISSDGCLSTVYENVDFYGEDFETLFTADYKECQKACTKHTGCQYFTFLTQDFSTPKYSNKCHLKHRRVFPSPPRVTSLNGVTSGFSHRICEGSITDGADCQHKILTDTNFPGNDFEQVPAPSTDYCHFLCNIHPHCSYYSYVRKDLVCFLKHNPNERPYKSKEGIMSGTPTRFCEPLKGDCSKSPYDNVEFPGFDRRFVLLDDLQSCQETCNADPDCQFYTYVHSSFFDPVHRRRCYLKQVITLPVPRKVATLENVVSGFHQRGCQQRTKENEDRKGLDCGELNSIKGRILGGEDAAPNSWPWQVSIQKRGAGHICGGSIISAQWVITAAHCFDSLNPSVFEVSSGTTDLSEANETHELDQIIKHPDFKEFTFENDICLLKLKRPINFTAAEGPVCLADMKVEEGIWDQKCWVTGWGKLSSGQFPKVLQEAQVPLIKPDTCNPLLQGRLVSNTMVCAGVPEGGVDTCQGDSGGPLVCQADGRWYLTGITSWGMGCGEAQKPGVYTRVSSYNNWIRGVVSR